MIFIHGRPQHIFQRGGGGGGRGANVNTYMDNFWYQADKHL